MTGPKTNERPGVRAHLGGARFSAYKAREVLNLVRGKTIAEARAILAYTERACAEDISKLLDSAVANAGNNNDIPPDELYISACYADEGPTIRRFRPRARARGRGSRIRKRTCTVTIIVSRLSQDDLDIVRAKAASRGTGRDAAGSRARRVAGSRKSGQGAADDAKATEATEATADDTTSEEPTSETAETTETTETAKFAAAGEVVEGPYGVGSALPYEDEPQTAPEGFDVKGNADSMKYHTPDSPYYEATVAEVWFDTAESAEAAGFEAPKNMPADTDGEGEN
jgi:large subunit ribosomal protein L22